MRPRGPAALTVALLASTWGAAQASGSTPEPRAPLRTGPLAVVDEPDRDGVQLVVKFDDRLRARVRGGELTSEVTRLEAPRLPGAAGVSWSALIQLAPSTLTALEDRATRGSGAAAPDLAGLVVASLPGGSTAELVALGIQLQDLPEVEFVQIEAVAPPPPGDLTPPSADLTLLQAHLGADPGLGFDGVADLPGARGQGVRIADCEYGWHTAHEDLVDVSLDPEAGQTPVSDVTDFGWDQHGTSVAGVLAAPDNGYGVTGATPAAELRLFPEWTDEEGYRRASAITAAIASSRPGDVVLLEMQTWSAAGGLVPAETDASIWLLTRLAVDAGVVVVAAGGNGSEDLDGPAHAAWQSWGDSGAILVGAGSASTTHDALPYSTFGSRIDVQSWGQDIVTLGYGDLAAFGGPSDVDQYYTSSFGGTSGAAALVAAAAASLQGRSLAVNGAPLMPDELREHLIVTGAPQGAGGPIGPAVDLGLAIEQLPTCSCPDFDGDGWQDPACGDDLCGFASDCDDTRAEAWPGAPELCSGADEDCDGLVDEGCGGALAGAAPPEVPAGEAEQPATFPALPAPAPIEEPAPPRALPEGLVTGGSSGCSQAAAPAISPALLLLALVLRRLR